MSATVVFLFSFLALAPLPNGIAGPAQLFTDALAATSIILLAVPVHRVSSRTFWAAAVFITAGITWALIGLMQGVPDVARVWGDTRPFLRLAAAIFIVTWAWARFGGNGAMRRLVSFSFIVSAYSLIVLMLTLAGATLFSVRTETATLYAGSATLISDSLRVSLSSGLFIVISGVMALRLLTIRTEGLRTVQLVFIVASSLVISLTAYSRSFFLLLVIAFALLLALGPLRIRLAGGLTALACVTGITLFLTYAVSTVLHLEAWEDLTSSTTAYIARVLNGLLADTLEVDASALWRVRESDAAVQYFTQNAVFGSGFGMPYRNYMFREIFAGSYGLTYVHNAYLWVLVKMGAFGAIILASVVLLALYGAVRARSRGIYPIGASTVVAIAVALAAVMIGSPIAFDSSGSVVVGGLLGICLVLGEAARGRQYFRRELHPGKTDTVGTSVTQLAVELRPLVRQQQFAIVTLQLRDPLRVPRRPAGCLARVDLGLPHPRAQRLRMDVQLVRDLLDRTELDPRILPRIQRQPRRPFPVLQFLAYFRTGATGTV